MGGLETAPPGCHMGASGTRVGTNVELPAPPATLQRQGGPGEVSGASKELGSQPRRQRQGWG